MRSTSAPSRSGSPRSSTTTSGRQSTTDAEGVGAPRPRCARRARRRPAPGQRLADPLVVLDHEHRCHRGWTLRRRRRPGDRVRGLNPALGCGLGRRRPGPGQDGAVRRTVALRRGCGSSAGALAVAVAVAAVVASVSDQVTGSRPGPAQRRGGGPGAGRATHLDHGTRRRDRPPPPRPGDRSTRGPARTTTTAAATGPTAPAPTTDHHPWPPPPTRAPTTSWAARHAAVLAQRGHGRDAPPPPGFTVEVERAHDGVQRVEFESDDHREPVDGWWDGGPQDEVREERD